MIIPVIFAYSREWEVKKIARTFWQKWDRKFLEPLDKKVRVRNNIFLDILRHKMALYDHTSDICLS